MQGHRIHSPPVSLIKEIMERQFHAHTTVPALQWGIDNKPCARQQFLHNAQHEHFNLRYFPAGLFVNPQYPHLGATPDGIISCDCCGTGIIEIKCPYKHLDSHPTEVNDDTFYLLQEPTGEIHLKKDHQYYYQKQGQLMLWEMQYCEFIICWTPFGMHTERILQQPTLFLNEIKPTFDTFFVRIILPMLLTGQIQYSERGGLTTSDSSDCTTFCWCGGKEGNMVACDNPMCETE